MKKAFVLTILFALACFLSADARIINVPKIADARMSVTMVGGGVPVAVGGGFVGNNAEDSGGNDGGGVCVRCSKHTATIGGYINYLTWDIGSWVVADLLYAGLYSHDATNDRPLNKLASGTLSEVMDGGGLFTVTLASGYLVVVDTVYWICGRVTEGGESAEFHYDVSATSGGRILRSCNWDETGLPANGETGYDDVSADLAVCYGN